MKKELKIGIQFFDMRKTLGIELVAGQQVRHPFSRHTHENLCIGLIDSGIRIFLCRGKQYKLTAGDIFLIPPHELHALSSEDGHNYKLILVYPDLLQMILPNIEKAGYRYDQLVFQDEMLYHELSDLTQLLCTKETIYLKQAGLLAVLSDILERSIVFTDDVSIKQYAVIDVAKQYIEENYNRNISLLELSAKSYLSPYHFIRVFSQTTGLPPHLFQQQLRLRQARKLLAEGIPIAEVASSVGFSDQSHFTHVFKNFMGVTPRGFTNSIFKQ